MRAGSWSRRVAVVVSSVAVVTAGLTASAVAEAASVSAVAGASSLPTPDSPKVTTQDPAFVRSPSPDDSPPTAGSLDGRHPVVAKGAGFDPVRSTPVPGLTTDRRMVFANPDGTFTARVSEGPVRVADGLGGWRDIDLSLRGDGKGGLVPGVSPIDERFPTDPTAGMAQVTTAAGQFGFALPDVAAGQSAATVTGSGASFAPVSGSGPSVVVTPTVHGFEHSVSFDSTGAKPSYRVTVTVPAGVVAKDTDRGVVLTDATGVPVGVLGGGIAHDASPALKQPAKVAPADRDGTAPGTAARVTTHLVGQQGTSVVIEHAVDARWLGDARRVAPIVFDPTYVFPNSGSGGDSYVDFWQPTTSFNSSGELWVGSMYNWTYPYPSYSQALLKFDLSQYVGADQAVFSSQLVMNGLRQNYCSGTTVQVSGLGAVPATGAAFDFQTSWSYHRPLTDGKGVRVSQATPPPIPNQFGCGFGPMAFDVTNLTQQWVRTGGVGAETNFGLQLSVPDGDMSSGVVFASIDGPNLPAAPYLQVTFNRVPDTTPSASTLADGGIVGTTQPTLSVTVPSDPEGDAMQCLFRVATGSDGEAGLIVTESPWTSCGSNPFSWTVPADRLVDGGTYYWHTWSRNVTGSPPSYSSSWGAQAPWVRKFTVNRRFGAGGPSPSDSAGPVRVNLATGNVTYQSSSPSFPTVGGNLGVSYTYNSLRGRPRGLVGSYYNNTGLSGAPVMVRTEGPVNFAWGTDQPFGHAVNADNFSARWTGYLTVPAGMGGSWQLGGQADDGFKVKIDTGSGLNTLVDKWMTYTWGSPQYGSVNLNAGQSYPIEVDFEEGGGNASVQFLGIGPGASVNQVIPIEWLSPESATLPTGWSMGADLGGSVTYTKAVAAGASMALTSADGSVETWTWTGSGWTPPNGGDGVLTGSPGVDLTLAASDGQVYSFNATGDLASVTSADSLKKPTAPNYHWTTTGGLTRMDTVTDPVSNRVITFTYGTGSGTDPCPSNGTSSRPPAGMLCQVDYGQFGGGTTKLYYNANFQLARIEDPGSELSDFKYNTDNLLSDIKDPLAMDMIAAGKRTDDGTASTLITYKATTDATYPSWASQVQLAAPTVGAARPAHSYDDSWFGVGIAKVHVTGANEPNGYARQVWYSNSTSDDSRRLLNNFDSAALNTAYTYDNLADAVSSVTDPAGFEHTTIFDTRQRPIETYGPAPLMCYDTNLKPKAVLPGGCPNPVPKATTAYDEGIVGLGATYWNNVNLAGTPAAIATGVGDATGKLNANWVAASPNPPDVNVDNWSARYSGDITFDQTGAYKLRVNAADNAGVRLAVDGKQVASHWAAPNHPEIVSLSLSQRAVFMRGTDDALWYRYWDSVTGWGNWINLGGVLTSDPGACVRPGTSGRVDVFVRGTDNAVWQLVIDQDGVHPWYSLGGSATGAPHCAGWDINNLTLVVPGSGNLLYRNTWNGTAWSNWAGLDAAHTVNTTSPDPSIASWGASRYDWFARGPGNDLQHWYTADNFAHVGWESLGGTLSEAPSVASWGSGRLDVVTRDTSLAMRHWWFDTSGSFQSESLGGTLTTAPSITSGAAGTVAVVVRGTDDYLWQTTFNATWANWAQQSFSLFRTGTFNVTDASKPLRISVELADRGGTANIGLQWQLPNTNTWVDVPGDHLNARYGLATSTVDPDSHKTTISYTGQGFDPALGIPTSTAVDPAGLNLTTASTFETNYYRTSASRLPKGDLNDANKRMTITNYRGSGDTGGVETRTLPTDTGCASGTNINQGGLAKLSIDPLPSDATKQSSNETIYDAAGRISATRQNGDARWACTLYDARSRATDTTDVASRVIHTQYYGAGTDPTCGTVDPNQACTRYVDSAGTTRSTRTDVDLLGRVTKYTDEQGTETRPVYDQAGRMIETWRKLPAGTDTKILVYALDTNNRPSMTTEYVSIGTGRTFTTGYDTTGRPVTADAPTDTNATRTTTTYDPATGRVSNLTTARNGTSFWTDGYGYTNAGKMNLDWSTAALTTYTYDNAGRLTTAAPNGGTTRNYAYDANTNRCAKATTCGTPTYTYDNADRLTLSPIGSSYGYDKHGNLTTYTKTGGGTVTIQYDAYDHATRIDDGTTRTDETLAPSGRVLRRTVTSPPGGTITEDTKLGYAGSGDSPAWAQPNSGGTVTTYLGGDIITGTTPSYQITNGHGDIIGTANQAGTFTASPPTDEFGVTTGTIPTSRLGWLGGHERFTSAPALGIMRMGVRLYDPNLGRFLEQDPVAGGSCNDYDYTCSDPVNGRDIDGTTSRPLSPLGIGPWEKRWCNVVGIRKCFLAAMAAKQAVMARMKYVRSHQLTIVQGNTFQHVYWMALVTRIAGKTRARQLGYAHELDNPRDDGPHDLHSNYAGRHLGSLPSVFTLESMALFYAEAPETCHWNFCSRENKVYQNLVGLQDPFAHL